MHCTLRMKTFGRALLILSLVAGFGSTASAGLVGFEIKPTSPAPDGSLDVKSDGSVVATNINVPIVFGSSTGGGTNPLVINSYLDFTTGHALGAAVDGVTSYSSADANFFILGGVLDDVLKGAGTPPVAMSINMSTTIVGPSVGSDVYTLLAVINNASVSTAVAAQYGLTGGSGYTGTLSLTFIFNSYLAGDQILGGTLSLTSPPPGGPGTNVGTVPAPPSVLLAGLGAFCTAVGPISARFRIRRHLLAA